MRMELYDGSDTPEGRDDFVIAFDIDPSLSDLVDFVDENEYDFPLYERRAASFSKAFRIYFNTLELTKSKESIIEVFLDDRHLTTHLAFPNRSHYEEKKLERKYRKLKELIRIELDNILKLDSNVGEGSTTSDPNDDEVAKTQFLKTFKNNFNNYSEEITYTHFKKSLVDTDLLSLKDLEKYLTAAFQNTNLDPPKEKMELLKNTPVMDMVFIIKDYSTICKEKPHNTKRKNKKDFANLIAKYFNGYDSIFHSWR